MDTGSVVTPSLFDQMIGWLGGANKNVTTPINSLSSKISGFFSSLAGGVKNISDALTVKTTSTVNFDYKNLIVPAIIIGGLIIVPKLLKSGKR